MALDDLTKRCLTLAFAMIFVLTCAQPLFAGDINLDSFPNVQKDFNNFVRDIGMGISYVPADPAESRGLIGFDIGAGITGVELDDNKSYIQDAFDDVPSTLVLPKLRVDKGLPIGGDVGGFVAGDPDGNVRVFGAAYKHCLMEGGVLFPAVALRVSGTKLIGVDDLNLRTYGADVSVSKGFDFPLVLGVTPYAGAGLTQIEGSEEAGIGLDDVSTSESKVFGGARFSLGFMNLVGEAEFAEVNRYTLRANIGL